MKASSTDQVVVDLGALLLGLLHLVRHLRERKICHSFNFKIFSKYFTSAVRRPMFSLMAMSTWVVWPRKSRRRKKIEVWVFILRSLQAQPLNLKVSEQLNQESVHYRITTKMYFFIFGPRVFACFLSPYLPGKFWTSGNHWFLAHRGSGRVEGDLGFAWTFSMFLLYFPRPVYSLWLTNNLWKHDPIPPRQDITHQLLLYIILL